MTVLDRLRDEYRMSFERSRLSLYTDRRERSGRLNRIQTPGIYHGHAALIPGLWENRGNPGVCFRGEMWDHERGVWAYFFPLDSLTPAEREAFTDDAPGWADYIRVYSRGMGRILHVSYVADTYMDRLLRGPEDPNSSDCCGDPDCEECAGTGAASLSTYESGDPE